MKFDILKLFVFCMQEDAKIDETRLFDGASPPLFQPLPHTIDNRFSNSAFYPPSFYHDFPPDYT